MAVWAPLVVQCILFGLGSFTELRDNGCKLKGSLWLIAGLLLINTFFSLFQALRLAEHQN